MKSRLAFGISIIFSVVCLWLAFQGVEFPAFVAALKKADVGLTLLALVVFISGYLVRCIRWQILLQNLEHRPRYRAVTNAFFIGYMVNNILPFRLGEIARAHAIGREADISRISSLATIFVERIIDGFCLILLLVLGIALYPAANWIKNLAMVSMFAFSTLLILCVVLVQTRSLTLQGIQRLAHSMLSNRPAAFVVTGFNAALAGLRPVTSFSSWGAVGFLSVLAWSLEAFVYFLVARSLGLVAVSYFDGCLIVGGVGLANLIPSAPATIGSFEFFATKMMEVVGVPSTQGIAFAVLLHVLQFVPVTLWGCLVLFRSGYSLPNRLDQTLRSPIRVHNPQNN